MFNVFLIHGRAIIDLRPATLCSFITIQIPQHPFQKSSSIGIRGTFLENFDTRRSSRAQDLNKQGVGSTSEFIENRDNVRYVAEDIQKIEPRLEVNEERFEMSRTKKRSRDFRVANLRLVAFWIRVPKSRPITLWEVLPAYITTYSDLRSVHVQELFQNCSV